MACKNAADGEVERLVEHAHVVQVSLGMCSPVRAVQVKRDFPLVAFKGVSDMHPRCAACGTGEGKEEHTVDRFAEKDDRAVCERTA